MDIIEFYWALHQIPDEQKLESLKEIRRILKSNGTLFSTSFGHWEAHAMPTSVYPIMKKATFMNLHASAGLKPRGEIEERSDSTRSFEKFWYGIFEKNP
jgi:ubiquinone/menaquinone biosynthesis C-methylase UbiE